MAVTDDLTPTQQLTAIAGILATGIIRLRCRAAEPESANNSPNSSPPALEHCTKTVLSVSNQVNEPENSPTNGDAHEH